MVQSDRSGKRAEIEVLLNGMKIKIQFDTGAEVGVINRTVWKAIGKPTLQEGKRLMSFGGGEVDSMGICDVMVGMKNKRKKLKAQIVYQSSKCLFGLSWCKAF
ncbi:hypothetical protein ACOME3_008256 [Neoechinorhynchus agilis]